MAIYHFSGTIISRSQGRSAIACAAYRSAKRLFDERYGKTHNYTSKQDVAFSDILLPENAPAWMKDREKLWNAVEQSEKRKDAQLAREFNFSLPRELTLEQNIVLAREFVQNEFVRVGMVADLCIHNDKMPDGSLQPHAHVMLTLREATSLGFGQKVREWNAKSNLLHWREAWSQHVNRTLCLHDIDVRVDHRSFKDQGIELEPQHKIGATLAKEHKANFFDHQRIAKENGEKILANPRIALDALTRQHSTFTRQDLARFIHRHTLDAEQFQHVTACVQRCKQLVSLGQDDLGRERFTTQTMLDLEATMLANAKQLSNQTLHFVRPAYQTQALSLRALTPEQKIAFEHLTSAQDLTCLVGFAGTGKSYLLGAAREAWQAQGYRVVGGTLSGIAAENLTGSSGIESRTLASHFYYWDKGEQRLSANDVLVIDEAGMIGSRQMARLLDEVESRGAKIVLIGDPQQLQAIDAGAAFRALCETVPYVELTDIRRQREAWQIEATKALAKGDIATAMDRYDQHAHVHGFETTQAAKQTLVAVWNDVRLSQPSTTQIMLAYTRLDVQELNAMARALRHQESELGQDHRVMTSRGERVFADKDRVYFLKNDRALGVMNGTLGTIEKVDDKAMTVRLDSSSHEPGEGKCITVNLAVYPHLDHGYAATIHKAQGVTIDRSYILASSYLDAHATYVGLSRHRESADIFWSREEFANEQALVTSLSRDRRKDISSDYRQPLTELQDSRSFTGHDQRPLVSDSLAEKQRAGFKDFKEKFRAKYPEHAAQLEEKLRPNCERLALAAEKRFDELEEKLAVSRMTNLVKEEITRHAREVAKQPEVMAYLKQHNRAFAHKVEALVRSLDRSRSRGL